MKVLELFAGSAHFSRFAKLMGHETFTIDWKQYGKIDKVMDIAELTLADLPWTPDVIWASPDCTSYSVAALYYHRNSDLKPKTDCAKTSDATNIHWVHLLRVLLDLNPNLVYFIENPRGAMRKMWWMQGLPRRTIWYCKYGDERAKPTDIWTNSKTWVPQPPCFNGNHACHHEASPRGSNTGTQARNHAYDRSLLPQRLIEEVVMSFTKLEPR